MLSSDGSVLLAGTVLIDVATGRATATINGVGEGFTAIRSYAISPSGTAVAVSDVGNAPDSADVLDARTGSLRRSLDVPSTWNLEVPFFDHDGSLVAESTDNAGIGLWDTRTGALIGQLVPARTDGFDVNASTVMFSADDGQLAALDVANGATGRWSLDTWSLAPGDMAVAACNIASRNLTHAEWNSFIGSGVPYERTCSQWPAGA